MTNHRIMALLLMAVLLLGAAFCWGCNLVEEDEDPAVQMAQQFQASAPPADVEPPAEAAPPLDVSEASEAEPGADDTGEGAEAAVAGEGEPAEDAAEEAEPAGEAEEGEATTGDEEPAAEEAEPGADEEDVEVGTAEEEVDAVSDDPIENFKALDPRDIIIKKYDDLKERQTAPWDETDPKGYLYDTGRIDPLTRVWDAVPDELKPPRAGDTDQNEIDSYLIADVATQLVNGYAAAIQCHNVIQIGLEKYVSLSFGGGQPFSVQEGFSTGFTVGMVNGIPIRLTLAVTSVATDEVRLRLTAAGEGTTTSVSKTQVYIPNALH